MRNRSGESASAKVSWSAGLRSMIVKIEHLPTGLTIDGEIPVENYTRKEMRLAQQKLKNDLIARITVQIARALRLPRN
jgi:hypothetical protein